MIQGYVNREKEFSCLFAEGTEVEQEISMCVEDFYVMFECIDDPESIVLIYAKPSRERELLFAGTMLSEGFQELPSVVEDLNRPLFGIGYVDSSGAINIDP